MANKRIWLIGAGLILVVGTPIAWYLISPLFIMRAVDEALPTARATEAVAEVPELDATLAPQATGAVATVAPTLAPQATDALTTVTVEPTDAPAEPTPDEAASTPQVLVQGSFYDVVHEGEGTATVYQLADGSRVLRFEDFMVLNGPDLHVWLVPVDPVPNTVGVEIAGYADLGKLKGNVGSQNYELPAGLDLSQFKSVVVWCQPFRVPFAAAALAAP